MCTVRSRSSPRNLAPHREGWGAISYDGYLDNANALDTQPAGDEGSCGLRVARCMKTSTWVYAWGERPRAQIGDGPGPLGSIDEAGWPPHRSEIDIRHIHYATGLRSPLHRRSRSFSVRRVGVLDCAVK